MSPEKFLLRLAFTKDDNPLRDGPLASLRSDLKLPETADRGEAPRAQRDVLSRTGCSWKLHRLDCREPEATTLSTARQASRLRQRLDKDHPRHDRISRKVSTEKRFLGAKGLPADGRLAALQFKHDIHEDERRTMRQPKPDRIALGHRSSTPSPGTK